MPSEFRTRIADDVTFHARIGDREIPLGEDELKAIGGILLGDAPGHARELRLLFGKGVLELGERRGIAAGRLASLLSCSADSVIRIDPRTKLSVSPFGEGMEARLEASDPLSWFIPPALGAALSRLATHLRDAAIAMQGNEMTRAMPVMKQEWMRTFGEIYREHCSSPPLSEYLRIADCPEQGFRLEVLKPLQADACPFPQARLRIRRIDLARGTEMVLAISIQSLPVIGRLVRQLHEGIGWPDLAALLDDPVAGADTGQVLEALARAKALAVGAWEKSPGESLFPPDAVLSALHLGHAGLMIGGGEAHVLVDPWFLPSHPDYGHQPPEPANLPPAAAILITHEHWDHIHPELVLRYPPGVPIVVPRLPPESPVYPRYRAFLELFGCERIIELGHWETMTLDDGMTVTAIPFRGEGTAEHPVARNCYLIELGGKRIFVHVDSSPDSHGLSDLSDGTIGRMVADYGSPDAIYATRRQELHLGWEMISDLYPVFLGTEPSRMLDVVENCCCPADYLAQLARETHCAMLVLYSEGGAEWFPDDTNFLRSDEAFRGHDHLWDSLETITAAVPAPVRLSMPLDTLCLDGEGATFIEGPLHA